jgi:tRNA(Ile)-lysidine synthase
VSRFRQHAEEAPLSEADFADVFAGLESAGTILVAVSGGPDSTALMGGLAEWAAAQSGPPLSVATIDHGLRPESREEAEGVAAASIRMGLPHAILTWTGARGARVSQEAARRARYRLLLTHAREIGATHLATAHTQDDQAETLMLRLAAGSGLSGLAGMRRETIRGAVRHVRPLLDMPKARLVATCRERGWSFVEDPSNRRTDFARARWRERLMPLLAAEGLDAARLGRLATRLARADDALDDLSRAAYARAARPAGPGVALDMSVLAAEPNEIALRVLKQAVVACAAGAREGGKAEPEAHLRLDRLEGALEAILVAHAAGMQARRTLAGYLIHLDRGGVLTLSPEPVRRRGKRDPVTPITRPDTASLGREPERA